MSRIKVDAKSNKNKILGHDDYDADQTDNNERNEVAPAIATITAILSPNRMQKATQKKRRRFTNQFRDTPNERAARMRVHSKITTLLH